jgi:hypothetical protein
MNQKTSALGIPHRFSRGENRSSGNQGSTSAWMAEQYNFGAINGVRPDHYKAKLENRTYVEGASREGQALKQVAKWRRPK